MSRIGSFVAGIVSDVRFTLRQIARAPFFSLVIVLILAIGIGVNSALFSLVDALIFQPAPGIPTSNRIVRFESKPSKFSSALSNDAYIALRDNPGVFSGIAASDGGYGITVEAAGNASVEQIRLVNGKYFSTLRPIMEVGVAPPDTRDDDRNNLLAVLSYNFWRKAYAGDRSVIGKTVTLDGVAFKVTGVLTRGYFETGSVFVPFSQRSAIYHGAPSFDEGGMQTIIGRVRDGVSLDAARSQLKVLMRRVPTRRGYSLIPDDVRPLRRTSQADIAFLMQPFGLISKVTIFILLIACANVSVLLLSRAVARRREVGIRLAIGANRFRVIRQLITEGLILAMAAAVGGLIILQWFDAAIERGFFPSADLSIKPSWHVVAVSAFFAVLTGLLFALAPALHATRIAVMDALRDASPGRDRQSTRIQNAFVVLEVALSMALVCAAGIFLDASLRTARLNRGYEGSPRTIGATFRVEDPRFPSDRMLGDLDGMVSKIEAIPGVERASYAMTLPNRGPAGIADVVGAGFATRNSLPSDSTAMATVSLDPVGPNFFSTIGVSLVAGREIDSTDIATSERTVVVDELVARSRWPGRNPIGQILSVRRWPTKWERDTAVKILKVVGVAPHLPEQGGGLPYIFLPATQEHDSTNAILVVRSVASSATPLIGNVTGVVRSVDRGLPLRDVSSFGQQYRRQHLGLYNAATISCIAGLLALALACVGLYATIAFGLAQRVREIGIRRALGADDGAVVYTFFEEGMRLALMGFAIGVPVALAAMKIGVASEFGVQALTTSSIAIVLGVLLTVCALASWLPARRAARVDALTALKQE